MDRSAQYPARLHSELTRVPRFSANLTFLFADQPFLDQFAAAEAAGFDAVEFAFAYEYDPREIACAARDARVEVALINAPPGDLDRGEFGLAALPGREAEARSSAAMALKYAQEIGCRRIHVMAGVIDPAHPSAQSTYRRNLDSICEMAAGAGAGIDVLIEPLSAAGRAGYFLADFEAAEQHIAAVARPNLKLQFDIFHRQLLHGDVIGGLQRMQPIIGHIQVASAPDRHEPETGELSDLRIFEHLDRMGYDGFVGAEYRPRQETTAGLGWFKPYAWSQ